MTMKKTFKWALIGIFTLVVGIGSGMFLCACIESYSKVVSAEIEESTLYKESIRFHAKFSAYGVEYGHSCVDVGTEQSDCINGGEFKLRSSFDARNMWMDRENRRRAAVRSHEIGIRFVYGICVGTEMTMDQCKSETMFWIETQVRKGVKNKL